MSEITTCVLGAKGSGKSVFLAEWVHTHNTRSILIDVLGVFNPRNAFKTAIIPNSYYCTSVANYISNYNKFPTNAKIVIDVSQYVGAALIDAINSLCDHILKHKTACAFLSDEIADIMPQMGKGSESFHRLVKNGRNFGIKPIIFATQRPQSVNKSIFDLCDTFYISSQKAPRTIEYILDIVDESGNSDMRKRIISLKQRQFLRFDGDLLKLHLVPHYDYAFKQ